MITLFRRGGHFCHVNKMFLPAYNSAKIIFLNPSRFSRVMITNVQPPFLWFIVYISSDDIRGRLGNAECCYLVILRSMTKLGNHAITVSGPLAWNCPPMTVGNSSLLSSLKSALKTLMVI